MTTLETIRNLVNDKMDVDNAEEYGDIYIFGYDLTETEIDNLMDWINVNALLVHSSFDGNKYRTTDNIDIMIDWYGEDI